MSRHGDITLAWADGEYRFRLGWGELIALQEDCDAGPAYILDRLVTGRWRVQDIRAVILHGLTGGGLEPARVRALVRRHVEEAALNEALPVAQAVLLAALNGSDEDKADLPPPEKSKADPAHLRAAS